MTNMLILIAAALLPAIVLCVYVFKKDRVEKEPAGLLIKLLIFGALSCLPAAYLEMGLDKIINLIFPGVEAAIQNDVPVPAAMYHSYNIVKNFAGIALVEEGIKFAILALATRKNREFNSLFDGLIYSVFVSLGFAAFENVLYVIPNGLGVAAMRAVLSVPGHMFYAVIMGYYYSIWHITEKAIDVEGDFMERGLIPAGASRFSTKKCVVYALLIPVLAHGFYDYCCSIGTGVSILVLIVFVIFLYIRCFGKIKEMSREDGYEHSYVRYMINRMYPGVYDAIDTDCGEVCDVEEV